MAGEVEVRAANAADALELALRLRPIEAEEVRAETGLAPLPVIVQSLGMSTEAWAARIDGELACVYGVVLSDESVLGGRTGVVWMLTTRVVERKPKAFWRGCRVALRDLFTRWDRLYNAIWLGHEKALRWGRRLGFVFAAPTPHGPAGQPFAPFTVTRECLHV